MSALRPHVRGNALDVVRADGFRPIAALPSESWFIPLDVPRVRGRAFELLDERRERDGAVQLDEDVHVVVGGSKGHEGRTKLRRFPTQAAVKERVAKLCERSPAIVDGPDDVNEHLGEGIGHDHASANLYAELRARSSGTTSPRTRRRGAALDGQPPVRARRAEIAKSADFSDELRAPDGGFPREAPVSTGVE
jgi:hypothetical protein